MICPRCGAEMPENATTCQSCSFAIDADEAAASDGPAPEEVPAPDADQAEGAEEPDIGEAAETGPDAPEAEEAAEEGGNGGMAEAAEGPADEDGAEAAVEAPEPAPDSSAEGEADAADVLGDAEGLPVEDDWPVGMKVKFTPYYDEELAKEHATSFEANPDAEQEASPFVSLATGYGTVADGGGAGRGLALDDGQPFDSAPVTLPAPAPRAQAPEKKKRIKPVAAVLIVALIAVAAIAGIVIWNNANQPEKTVYTGSVEVSLDIPGYDGGSSPVPIKVSGTEAATQEPVFETFLLTPGDNKIDLNEGRYHFAVEGSPVTSGGIIFSVPRESHEVTIASDGITVDGSPASGPSFTFTALAAENVTDQGIALVREWMVDAGLPQESIDSYIGSISGARGARVAQIEEEKRAAAEAKATAERQANLKERQPDYGISRTVNAGDFSFGLPSAWSDRVAHEEYSGGNQSLAIVYLEGNRNLKLLEIAKYPIADGQSYLLRNAAIAAGDESGYVPGDGSIEYAEGGADMATVATWDNGDYRFEVTTCEWPAHFARDASYMGCTEEQRDALTQMSTGGRFSYGDLAVLDEASYAAAASDLVKNAVIPSIDPKATTVPGSPE